LRGERLNKRGPKSLKEKTSLANLGASPTTKIFIALGAGFRKGKKG